MEKRAVDVNETNFKAAFVKVELPYLSKVAGCSEKLLVFYGHGWINSQAGILHGTPERLHAHRTRVLKGPLGD